MGNLVRQRDQIKTMLKKISREERNDLRDVTMKAMDSLKFCIKVFYSSPNLKYVREDFREIKESVDVLEEDFNAVMKAKKEKESEAEGDQSYKDAFKVALANFIRERIAEFFRNKPQLLEDNVAKFLQITYSAEVAKHGKSKRPWKELRLGSNISKNVGNFLQKRMAQQMPANRVLDD